MLKQHVLNTVMHAESHVKTSRLLKIFMLGMLKTVLKTVLKYEKKTITLYSKCQNWAADFVFLLRFLHE